MTEYKLSYTASDINRRLGKVSEIDTLRTLVDETVARTEDLNNLMEEEFNSLRSEIGLNLTELASLVGGDA